MTSSRPKNKGYVLLAVCLASIYTYTRDEEYLLKLTLVQLNYHSLKSKKPAYMKVYIFLKHMNYQISRVPKWLHVSNCVVTMVTKKTRILFFYINFFSDWNALIRYMWQVCYLK